MRDERDEDVMMYVNGLHGDKNVDEEPEKWFIVDLAADAWETSNLDHISPNLITQAKQKEIKQLWDMATFKVVDRKSLSSEAKIIGTRWVIVNKGDVDVPNVKARLVAQEFANE